MKEKILLRSADGYIIEEVDAKKCAYDEEAFINRSNGGLWAVTDRKTGLHIVTAKTLKLLEENYNSRKERLLEIRNGHNYKLMVERFEKLKAL